MKKLIALATASPTAAIRVPGHSAIILTATSATGHAAAYPSKGKSQSAGTT